MRLTLLLFVLSVFSLFADPKEHYPLAVTEGDRAAIVDDCVSAITGDLYLTQVDALIQGYVPLRLPRQYISGDGKGELGNWSFMKHMEATYKGGEKEHTIKIQESNGSIFAFKCSAEEVWSHFRKSKHTPKFRPPSHTETAGLTNTSQGEISGRSNLKNASVRLEEEGKYLSAYCPDQTQRRYKVHHERKHFKDVFKEEEDRKVKYLLESETLPSGHKVIYDYDKEDRLKSIRTANPGKNKTYASATFHYHHSAADKIPNLDIALSDGRTLRYRYEEKGDKDAFLLRSVQTPESPEENIYYYPRGHRSGNLVSQIALSDHRYYKVEYYREGTNDVGGTGVRIKDVDDPRFLRVKTLTAPVGTDATPYVTHRFFYFPEKRYTEVREIDNALTSYHYTPSMRIETILRFDNHNVLNHREIFEWSDTGDLRSRSFIDSSGKALLTRRFHYDDHGNVLREDFCGDLSGQGRNETYTIKRDYTNDERHLLIKEEEQNGKTTLYTYHDKSSLLAAKFICEDNQIKIRTFYEYNGDHVLMREAQDDGISQNKNDLSGVKTRTIKVITPVSNGPYVDMPQCIEEKYWDGSREILLKKSIFTYTTGGRIESQAVYDANGTHCYTLKNTYDAFGRLATETNAIRQVAEYTYDAIGNRKTAKTPSQRRTATMHYDFCNRLVGLEEVGFDGIAHFSHYGYNGKHHKIFSIDPYGNTTRYAPDSFGHVVETHLPQVLDENGNAVSPILHSNYDSAGRESIRTDAKGYSTATRYNARSQVTETQHPDGFCERFIYNLDGSLKVHFDAEGFETKHTYDAFGRRTSTKDARGNTTVYTYDSFHLLSIKDAEGYITTYTYDGAGRKIAEERNKERIEYGYDSLNRLALVKTGDLFQYTNYDFLSRVIEERQEDSKGNLISKINYEYDEAGNQKCITRSIMGKEVQEHFEYDSFDRLILKIDALGNETRISYNENHQNELGQRVLQKITTDALSQKTIETYDALGRRVCIEIQNPHGEICSLEEKYYDRNNNLSSQVSTLFPQKKTVEIQWNYNNRNRLCSLTEADTKITQYTYTHNGLLKETIKPDGVILKREYDPNGNLSLLNSSDRSVAYSYQYNRLNQFTSSTDLISHQSTLRTLDSHGRVLKETLSHNLVIAHAYDLQGRPIQLTFPNQSFVNYTYDAIHLKEVSRYNTSGILQYTHRYEDYDLSHNLLSEHLIANLGEVAYRISPLGKCDATDSSFFNQNVLSYDPVGNIAALSTQSQNTTYHYDDLYQLIEETGPFPHIYAYDSHFNRLQKDNQTFSLNALNQLSTIQYDPNGNPRLIEDAIYSYDALDRLIRIETPHMRLDFAYDSFHRRLSKTFYKQLNGIWQCTDQHLYLYDGQNEIGTTDSTGKIIQLRTLGATPHAEIGAAIAIELEGRVYAPLHDLFGNVIALISPDGTMAESYRYDSFGNHTATSQLSNPWRFASKRLDETGLIYYGRRYFDPASGRWITPDPIGFEGGINLYAFVQNNPLNHLDLYGLMSVDPSMPVSVPMVTAPKVITPMIVPKRVSTKQVADTPYLTPIVYGPHSGSSKGSVSKNLSLGALEGMGHCSIALAGGLANCGQLISAPFYFLSGQWAHWGEHWNQLKNSNAYLHQAWQQQMQNLLPNEQRLSYYPHITSTAESIYDGILLAATAGSALLPKGIKSVGYRLPPAAPKIDSAVKGVEEFLGGKGRVITNADGDMILMRGDRKIRFDIKDPHGDKPHFHLEKKNPKGKWVDAGPEHRYYLTEE